MQRFDFPYFELNDGNLDANGRLVKKIVTVYAESREEAIEKAVEALYGYR